MRFFDSTTAHQSSGVFSTAGKKNTIHCCCSSIALLVITAHNQVVYEIPTLKSEHKGRICYGA